MAAHAVLKNEFTEDTKYLLMTWLISLLSSKLLRINARLQKKSTSSTDNSRIKAEEIIKAPHETPKMVKAVIQVLTTCLL